MAESLLGIDTIDVVHKVLVVARNLTTAQELIHARAGHRVEIAANDERDLGRVRVAWSAERLGWLRRRVVAIAISSRLGWRRVRVGDEHWGELGELGSDLFDLLDEHRRLDELDVSEDLIPLDVDVGNDETRARRGVFEQTHNGNVILAHDSVEHIVRLAHVGPLKSDLIELNDALFNEVVPDKDTIEKMGKQKRSKTQSEVIYSAGRTRAPTSLRMTIRTRGAVRCGGMHQDSLRRLPERGASVDVLLFLLGHRSRARLGEEGTLVALARKVGEEAIVVLFLVDFL